MWYSCSPRDQVLSKPQNWVTPKVPIVRPFLVNKEPINIPLCPPSHNIGIQVLAWLCNPDRFEELWSYLEIVLRKIIDNLLTDAIDITCSNLSNTISEETSSKQEIRTLFAMDSTVDHIDHVWHHCLVLLLEKPCGWNQALQSHGFNYASISWHHRIG